MTLDLLAVVKEAMRDVLREERRLSPAAAPSDGYLKLQHAAEFAGVSKTTLKQWCRNGLKVHGRGRVRLVEKAELRRFVERGGTDSTTETPEDFAAAALAKLRRVR